MHVHYNTYMCVNNIRPELAYVLTWGNSHMITCQKYLEIHTGIVRSTSCTIFHNRNISYTNRDDKLDNINICMAYSFTVSFLTETIVHLTWLLELCGSDPCRSNASVQQLLSQQSVNWRGENVHFSDGLNGWIRTFHFTFVVHYNTSIILKIYEQSVLSSDWLALTNHHGWHYCEKRTDRNPYITHT